MLAVPAASADPIDGAITSVTLMTAGPVGQWDVVDFACTWAVPDGSAADDTFSLQLPAQLSWWGAADFNLTDEDGSVVATAHAGSDGLVLFTLTDYVSTHPNNVHGTCAFATQFTSVVTTPGANVLDFDVNGTVVQVPVETEQPCTVDCVANTHPEPYKYMWWTDPTQSRTQSVIGTGELTNDANAVTITDLPGDGLTLDCDSVSVRVGSQIDINGYVGEPGDTALFPPAVSECSGTSLTVSWADLPKGEYAEVWVTATVTTPGLVSYTNGGKVTINGQDAPVTTTVRQSSASGSGSGTSVPATTPDTTTPDTTVPSTTVPSTTVPSTTVPSTTAASTTTPTAVISVESSSSQRYPTSTTTPTTEPVVLAATGSGMPAWLPVVGISAVIAGLALLLGGRRRTAQH